ncbi:MAG TPA: methane monooxygenase/ammonia monooxygenase subunit C [Gammaproteobacteria bacterium]|nr:methane monooxygenase/ammonia monooxygenase subunit C [Gammaproteobacteria bacterium]
MSSNAIVHDSNEIAVEEKAAGDEWVCWGTLAKVIVGIVIAYVGVRAYMHAFAFSVGLDYFEPVFKAYWMNMLYAELVFSVVTLAGICTYLWRTRDRSLETLTPEEELSRYFKWATWLVSYTLVVMIIGPIAGESDAAWHQVVIRDTDFTPTHISLFYLMVPMLIVTGVGSFLYATTRLPMHSNKHLISLGIAIGGPILIAPNIGLNEWGHTFYYAEELFGAPVHWGFAGLGLALLALGGVVVHVVQRMKELIDEVVARA